MPRVSRDAARQHRDQVLTAASQLVRAHGADHVSVPQVMRSAGLTHGGFYRHFASKDDLIGQACTAAFAERRGALDALLEQDDAQHTARATFLAGYLSALHRDNPALGCPAAALAADAAHARPGDPLRVAYTDGLRNLIEGVTRLTTASDAAADEDHALVELSTIVGATVLARASAGSEVSDRILAAVRHYLTGRDDPSDDPDEAD